MGLAEKGRARLIRAAEPLVNPPSAIDEGELRASVAGKVALVTGASYGLGEATARRLGAAGATVLLTARSAERLEEIAAEIRAAGGDAHVHAADMTDTESVEALAEWVLAEHDHVDVVVSNAGKSIRRSVELSYDRFHDFERTIGINYLGPVRLLLALLPSMRARGAGHIVNVSTIGARIAPGPRWGAYQASKSAFDIWLRSVAPELRGDGVTATSVYMALIHTRMSAPTPIYRHVPGQTPEQAAATISARSCGGHVRSPPGGPRSPTWRRRWDAPLGRRRVVCSSASPKTPRPREGARERDLIGTRRSRRRVLTCSSTPGSAGRRSGRFATPAGSPRCRRRACRLPYGRCGWDSGRRPL